MADNYKDLIQESVILPALKFNFICDAAAGNHTVTGIATRDKLVSVMAVSFTLSEGTPNTVAIANVGDLTSEFTITAANTINNTGGTALTDMFALVVWLDIPEALG